MVDSTSKPPELRQRIFEYDDYRRFLADFVEQSRGAKRGFSHRAFAVKAGLTSPSLLLDVIKGKLGLTPKTLPCIVKGVGLRGRAARYFEALVRFNQATGFDDRDRCFRRLQHVKTGAALVRLDSRHRAYVARWYHQVIRELAVFANWRNDFEVLAGMVRPAITPRQAQESVRLLLDLGLLVRNADGSMAQTSPAVTVIDLPSSAKSAVRNELLLLGVEAARSMGPDERHVAHTTLSMSRHGYEQATRILDEARRRILDLAIADPGVERVFELVLQMFPLSAAVASANGGAKAQTDEVGARSPQENHTDSQRNP